MSNGIVVQKMPKGKVSLRYGPTKYYVHEKVDIIYAKAQFNRFLTILKEGHG